MKEIGRVVSVNGNRAVVMVKRTEACAKCGRCAHAHIAFGDNSTITIEAVSHEKLSPGDVVLLEMDNSEYLKATFLVYGLPLVMSGAMYGIGWLLGGALGSGNLWGTILAMAGFAGSFAWLYNYDRSARRAGRYLPHAWPLKGESAGEVDGRL